jgi:hypothetical protein
MKSAPCVTKARAEEFISCIERQLRQLRDHRGAIKVLHSANVKHNFVEFGCEDLKDSKDDT